MNSTMQIKFGAGAENSIIASGDVVLLQKKKKAWTTKYPGRPLYGHVGCDVQTMGTDTQKVS